MRLSQVEVCCAVGARRVGCAVSNNGGRRGMGSAESGAFGTVTI